MTLHSLDPNVRLNLRIHLSNMEAHKSSWFGEVSDYLCLGTKAQLETIVKIERFVYERYRGFSDVITRYPKLLQGQCLVACADQNVYTVYSHAQIKQMEALCRIEGISTLEWAILEVPECVRDALEEFYAPAGGGMSGW